MRGQLIDDSESVAPLYARSIEQIGVRGRSARSPSRFTRQDRRRPRRSRRPPGATI
jgi:hypothetical protein